MGRQSYNCRREFDFVDVLLVLVLLHDAVVLGRELDRVLTHVLRETILCSVQLELNLLVYLTIREQLGSRGNLKKMQ